MKLLIALSVVAVTMIATSTAQAQTLRLYHRPWTEMTKPMKIHYLKRQIHHDNSIIRYWHNHRSLATAKTALWVKWAHTSLRIAQKSLHKLSAPVISGDMSAWLCIHRYEGSWTDPNGPYWGGLQMDLGFQETYGGEFLRKLGTADHWPVAIQLLVARRARDGYGRYGPRGYSPWPNTARYCGLL